MQISVRDNIFLFFFAYALQVRNAQVIRRTRRLRAEPYYDDDVSKLLRAPPRIMRARAPVGALAIIISRWTISVDSGGRTGQCRGRVQHDTRAPSSAEVREGYQCWGRRWRCGR